MKFGLLRAVAGITGRHAPQESAGTYGDSDFERHYWYTSVEPVDGVVHNPRPGGQPAGVYGIASHRRSAGLGVTVPGGSEEDDPEFTLSSRAHRCS